MYRSIFQQGLFDGQAVIVTGGGSGIGRCTAHELASLGAKVLITGRTVEKLERTAAEIREDGGKVAHYAFDIRDEAQVQANVAAMLKEHGGIHGLVNNAGGQFPAPVASISKKGWDAVIANNLTGGFLMAREVYNQHMKKHGGAIVNMLADFWRGMPMMAHSGAARAGMMSFTETAALEWAASGVRVNAVAPGFVASSGMDHYDPSFAKEVMPKLGKMAPLKRMAEEAEVSSAIVFLLSPGAAYITGSCVRIDGGTSLNPKVYAVADHQRSAPYQGFHRATRPQALNPDKLAGDKGKG